jgi:uncharacterized SAM-binding protein YcdF (DUF218 family)
MPWCANQLAIWVEGPYQWQPVASAPKVDAVVVLSGDLTVKRKDEQLQWEFQDADRFMAGLALMKAQRAPKLIFTGGQLPWNPQGTNEGLAHKALAIELGMSERLIEVSGLANNTEQESQAVMRLWSNSSRKIILVTSAFHMPRAKKLFIKQGFDVTEWPVDYKQSHNEFTWLELLPTAEKLSLSSQMLREMLGRAYYRVKEWML